MFSHSHRRFGVCSIAIRCLAPTAIAVLAPSTASAHVKWFEAYEVAAKPTSILTTLALPYFWVALLLVLAFFIATTVLEQTQPGRLALQGMDRVTSVLQLRADQFLLGVLAAFFVSLFAVGGTYLTPDLKTQSELVAWAQIGIAALIPMRRTRPIAAIAIVILWLFTLRDYDLFHLFDYLALGLGLAGYLLLSGMPDGKWHDRRFGVLRWGIALALTWSSMEKFMYPQWFMPLLEEKPFLAFGIPFREYTTMAGVAEFTLGFGLLWTPLVRRLSALALFTLMFAAVYPFGRVDMIGHATILASLLVVLADPQREDALEIAPKGKLATILVPAGLAVALAVTMVSYAGLHNVIYDRATGVLANLLRPESRTTASSTGAAPGAFWRGNEHYHGDATGNSAPGAGAAAAMIEQMNNMHANTSSVSVTGDVTRDFIALMVPHHQAAVDMARIYLETGDDPRMRLLAEHIISEQAKEIEQMHTLVSGKNKTQTHH